MLKSCRKWAYLEKSVENINRKFQGGRVKVELQGVCQNLIKKNGGFQGVSVKNFQKLHRGRRVVVYSTGNLRESTPKKKNRYPQHGEYNSFF